MKKLFYFLLVSMLTITTLPAKAQVWQQMGGDIIGEHEEDHCGYAVSINDDGTIVAIGTEQSDGGNGTKAGDVKVYKYNAGSWEKIGNTIGGYYYHKFGSAVSLNSNGTIVAIGAPDNSYGNYMQGAVSIYKNDNGTWTQIGSDILGQNIGDHLGKSVSINSDGSVVVMGAPYHDHDGSDKGEVRVFKNFSGAWGQIGYDIFGENGKDEFGTSVSINSDGTVIACGAPYNDANGINSGAVKVYKYINSTWTQVGNDILGNDKDYFGWSVSLSDDGTIIAVGGTLYYGSYAVIRIFRYDGNSWTQIGSDITSQWNQLGFSVSLNSDGTIVAAGAPLNATYGTKAGSVRVFKNINNTWTQIGQDIEGPSEYAEMGHSVSISANGSVVVAGAPYSKNDTEYYCGMARIYNNSTATYVKKARENKQPDIYPNPVSGLMNVDLSFTGIHTITVSDITGRIVFEKTGNDQHERFDLSNLRKGIYILKVKSEDMIYQTKFIKQ